MTWLKLVCHHYYYLFRKIFAFNLFIFINFSLFMSDTFHSACISEKKANIIKNYILMWQLKYWKDLNVIKILLKTSEFICTDTRKMHYYNLVRNIHKYELIVRRMMHTWRRSLCSVYIHTAATDDTRDMKLHIQSCFKILFVYASVIALLVLTFALCDFAFWSELEIHFN